MKINYPNGKIASSNKSLSATRRGMEFEHDLNMSNEYYRVHEIAVIYKKPTPVQIVKVDYPARNKAKIIEAYYQTPSTTDYNGIYRGKYIDFEAKQSSNNTFYFRNIFEHQVKHLIACRKLGGIAFVIIYFKKINTVYLVDIDEFQKRYFSKEKPDLSINDIEELITINKASQANIGYMPVIDYISSINKMYFNE